MTIKANLLCHIEEFLYLGDQECEPVPAAADHRRGDCDRHYLRLRCGWRR